MQRQIAPFAIAMALGIFASPCDAAVTVFFASPDSYTDAGDLERDPQQTLALIERYLKDVGERFLAPQESLRIEVLNVTLACRPRLLGTQYAVTRVCTGEADWPRIELRYALVSRSGQTMRGAELVADTTYLRRLEPAYSSAALPYEKRMLDNWFRARFAALEPEH
jgi:hypothetical protein